MWVYMLFVCGIEIDDLHKISFKSSIEVSEPIAALLSVVGLEEYSLGLVSRYSTVRSGTLTWREWGLWVCMREAIAQARDLLFTTRRNGVKCVKYICMKLPYVAQQVGKAYFYRLTEIKELSGSLWWMHEGRNLLPSLEWWDAGCSAMWTWRESRVTKIWGFEHDHGFVLFLFATTGFHIARSGIFWTPTFVL